MKAPDLTNPVAAAVEVYRKPAVEHARQTAAAYAKGLLKKLEEAGWDLDVVAPRPRSNMSRYEYSRMNGYRYQFEEITSAAPRRSYMPDQPDIRVRDDARVTKFIDRAGKDAEAAFRAYVAKLTRKVGEGVLRATVDSGSLWTYSTLTVWKADGSTEYWRTQCIVNFSVLGKMFNQWPTRRVDR